MTEGASGDPQMGPQANEFLQVNIKQEVYSDGEEPYTDMGNFLECAVKDELGLYPSTEEILHRTIRQADSISRALLESKKPKRGRKDTRKRKPRPPKPKTLQCDFCEKAFSNVFHLRDHVSSHTQERIECKICRLTLRTTSMRAHMYRHKNNKSHQCEYCMEKFVRKYSLKEHVLNVHLSESVTCPICMKTLKRSSFNKHTTLHTNEKKHKCEACNKGFNTVHKLKNHLVTHTNERPFACDDCGSTFKNKDSLKAHIKTHLVDSKVKNYACEICSNRYSEPSHLTLHMKRHLGIKSHACHLCNRKFLLKASLRSHLRIHDTPKAYRCQECGRGFDYLNFLNQHIRIIHLGEGTVICPICNKSFTQQASLVKHKKKIHNITSPTQLDYRCDQCDKNFRTALSLEVHMQTHTGERGFTCSACNKKFRHKTGLMRHVKTHAELQFECRTCGWSFTDPKRFTNHINFHLLEKPFECSQVGCTKKFPRQSALNRHLRSAHKFWCDQCKKTFHDASHFDKHMYFHKATRGFVCKLCGRRFVLKSSMDTHLKKPHRPLKKRLWCGKCLKSFYDKKTFENHKKVHSEDRRTCTVCSRTFRSEGGLTAHQDKEHTVHIEKFWCSACDVGFTDEKDLANHMEFHTGTRVLACAVCFKAYTHKATLNRHLKTHGPNVQLSEFRCKHCGKTFKDSRPYGNHLKLHSGEHPFECHVCGKTFRSGINHLLHKKKFHKIDI